MDVTDQIFRRLKTPFGLNTLEIQAWPNDLAWSLYRLTPTVAVHKIKIRENIHAQINKSVNSGGFMRFMFCVKMTTIEKKGINGIKMSSYWYETITLGQQICNFVSSKMGVFVSVTALPQVVASCKRGF